MKPLYSIEELANILQEPFYTVADGLIAGGAILTYASNPADLSQWKDLGPIHIGENDVIIVSDQLPVPHPSRVIVTSESLSQSWKECINHHERGVSPPPTAIAAPPPEISPLISSHNIQQAAPAVTKHLRRNTLDPAIEKAIQQAGSMNVADVYLKLKELALAAESPFTGAFDGNALCYTNDNNQPSKLSKDALGKRLRNRRKATLIDV